MAKGGIGQTGTFVHLCVKNLLHEVSLFCAIFYHMYDHVLQSPTNYLPTKWTTRDAIFEQCCSLDSTPASFGL